MIHKHNFNQRYHKKRQQGRWGIFRAPNGDVAVSPLRDEQRHRKYDSDCPCRPKVTTQGATLLFTHNAYDFREVFEDLNMLMDDVLAENPHK